LPASETTSLSSKTFYFNISENYNLSQCYLIMNHSVVLINSSVNTSATNQFNLSLGPGTYNWSINCSDSASNVANSSSQSFIITAPASTNTVGGSGGGSSSIYKTYTITEKESNIGYNKKLGKNDKIKFLKNNITHTLTVKKIENDYVNLTIQSNPVNFILNNNQEIKLNLSSDRFYDVYVKLNSIENNKANITLKTINEIINKTIPTENEAEPGPEKTKVVVFDEKPNEENNETGSKYLFFIILSVVLLILFIFIILILFFIFRKKPKKKKKRMKK